MKLVGLAFVVLAALAGGYVLSGSLWRALLFAGIAGLAAWCMGEATA
jgi:hypothetical protein